MTQLRALPALPVQTAAVFGRRVWVGIAVLRLAVGFTFLWAFFDKAFGFGYPTLTSAAWIRGGSPSEGFLTGAEVVGPLKPIFLAIAGPASDILFMIGLLTVGLAVMAGIGLRISAVLGSLILVLMYLAEWPFDKNTASTNPLVDSHLVYALVLIAVALMSAGDTWGFGLDWKRLPFVQRRPWLI